MNIEDLNKLLQSADDEMQKGNLLKGLDILEQFFPHVPNHAPALDLAARGHLALGQADKALARAQKAVELQPIAAFVTTLGEALREIGDLQKAALHFSKVLEKLPTDVRALRGLGDIYEKATARRFAIKCYTKILAIQPDNLEIAIRYSNLLSIPELTVGLEAVIRARPADNAKPQRLFAYLNHTATYKEWAERTRAGLMPYHATKMDELFFTYGAAERDEYMRVAERVLQANAEDKGAIAAMACTLFSLGRRVESEIYFEKLSKNKPGTINENIAFQPQFFENLERMPESDLEKQLPPLLEILPQTFSDKDIIYLSCNYQYYVDFARIMLLSIDSETPNTQVHLHIMDGSDEEWATVKSFCAALTKTKIAISAERPGMDQRDNMEARCYYHAIRFIRLYHHLRKYDKTLWLMDVDALVRRDPAPMFAAMGNTDAAFRVRPGRWDPWNQFNASVMAIAPTPAGIEYLRLIAAYVAHFYAHNRLRWGIDQLAMYAVYEYLKELGKAPQVELLDDRAVDYECFDDSFVWCNSGRGKFLQLKMLELGQEESSDADRSKYFNALKKYAARLK